MAILGINGQPIETIGDDNYGDYLDVRTDEGYEAYGCLPPGDDDMMCSLRAVPWEASGLVVYDEKELGERLEAMWAAQASIMHRVYHTDCLKQTRGTCWIHGTCQAAMQLLEMSNLPYRDISPASVAYHCYSNFGVNGGYPAKGVAEFQDNGACDLANWPENGFSRSYDTAASKANRVHQWLEEVVILDGGGEERFIKLLSAHVQGKPGGASFNWWNHYVCSCWGRLDGRELKLGIRNSWGNSGYGDKGFGLLAGSRKHPSWACVFLRMRQSVGEKK